LQIDIAISECSEFTNHPMRMCGILFILLSKAMLAAAVKKINTIFIMAGFHGDNVVAS
jgi:hypothetical protein